MLAKITKPLLFIALLFTASCKLEPCKNYRCLNGDPLEDFNDCVCNCRTGWFGVDCSQEDKCATNNVVCKNQGYCTGSTGLCTCVSGFEGDSCQILSRSKFLNSGDSALWDATDTCNFLIYHYVAEIEPGGADNRTLEIYNVRQLSATQFIVANANKMTFEQKLRASFGTVDIDDLFGTLSSDHQTLRITYKSIEGNTTNCKGVWTRQ